MHCRRELQGLLRHLQVCTANRTRKVQPKYQCTRRKKRTPHTLQTVTRQPLHLTFSNRGSPLPNSQQLAAASAAGAPSTAPFTSHKTATATRPACGTHTPTSSHTKYTKPLREAAFYISGRPGQATDWSTRRHISIAVPTSAHAARIHGSSAPGMWSPPVMCFPPGGLDKLFTAEHPDKLLLEKVLHSAPHPLGSSGTPGMSRD